jgi:hypothetical protein
MEIFGKTSLKNAFFVIIFLIMTFLLAGCPSTLPCDEKVPNPKIIENLVLSNEVIQQINSELTLREVVISSCFVNNKVEIAVQYELPASYSAFNLSYIDNLFLDYFKEGNIELADHIRQPAAFELEATTNYFQQKIQELESNPRIREVLTSTNPDNSKPIIPRYEDMIISRSGDNRIEYSFYYGLVRGYTLSNNIEFLEFPEITLAHSIIEENLLVGPLSGCSIGRGDIHAYTSGALQDPLSGPWHLSVALICDDGWKDAFVQINNDGTFERLAIKNEY